jgi:hypothetical protein
MTPNRIAGAIIAVSLVVFVGIVWYGVSTREIYSIEGRQVIQPRSR